MADDHPPPPLPTPTAQTAIKQAVATAHDAPDRSPVDGESPLPPRPLFTRPLLSLRKMISLTIVTMMNVWWRCRCHRQPHRVRGSVSSTTMAARAAAAPRLF